MLPLDVSGYFPYKAHPDDLPLSCLRCIEDIWITPSAHKASWTSLSTLLNEVESPKLNLRIDCASSAIRADLEKRGYEPRLYLEDEDFEKLDVVLANLKNLKHVQFSAWVPRRYDDTAGLVESIQTRLPKAHARGVIMSAILHVHLLENELIL